MRKGLWAGWLLCGCANFTPPGWMTGQPAPPPTPSDYAAMPFSAAFDAAAPGARVRVHVLFDAVEDTVLDLPEEYGAGWLRVVVGDPSSPDARSANVVVAESNRRFLSELPRGQALDLFVTRAVHQDPMLANGAPTIVLRVEKLRRHVSESARRAAPAPAAPPAAAAPAAEAPVPAAPVPAPGDGSRVYRNRSKDDLLRLMPDGRFEIRQRGRTIAGTYMLEASTLTFILPNGHRAMARSEGEIVTDPDGKTWTLRK
ncbi:MAG: hypothetical protein HY553_08215 [Elusimicrobia bacterium]|nr:hypothetical protein [Elusimicrobiota bacterium]